MSGPPPKNPATRQRRNKVSTAAALSAPRIRIPTKLPEPRIVEVEDIKIIREWHPFVVEFWRDLRRSPMVGEYVQSDLHRLYMLADLLDLYWYGSRGLAVEIRLQGQCFGLTPLDRRRLQWEIQKVEEGERRRKPAPLSDTKPSLKLMEALA